MAGASTRTKVRHERECPLCYEDLEDVVTILPCNHALCGNCHAALFNSYEERKKVFINFCQNPPENIETIEYRDWPPNPAPPSCPFQCPGTLTRFGGRTLVDYVNKFKKTNLPKDATDEEKGKAAYRKKRNKRRNKNKWNKIKRESGSI